jgi:hypothetical protein
MWIAVLGLLLLAAHLNLTGLVPLHAGEAPPPWWVGGRLLWPFAEETNTLVFSGDAANALLPILGSTAALCFLLAAAALLHWQIPENWFTGLIITGVALSIALQIVWFTGWAILPLAVDAVLLWAVFGRHITVASLRG